MHDTLRFDGRDNPALDETYDAEKDAYLASLTAQ
jgi:hypothetical protein